MTQFRFAAVFALVLLAGCSRLGEPAPVSFRNGDGSGAGYSVAVRQGDTLDSLAQRYRLSASDLAQANRLQPPYNLRTGQVLLIPPPAAHTVKSGDTVAGIANFYGVDEVALAQTNGLHKPYQMRVGQVLALPGGVGGRGTAAMASAAPMMSEGPPPPPRSSISAAPLPPPGAVAAAPATLPPPAPEPVAPAPVLKAPSPSTPAPAPSVAITSPTALAPQIVPPPATVAVTPAVPVLAPPAPSVVPVPVTPATPAPSAPAQVAAAGAPHFLMPVNGQVVSNFGADSGGQKNEGINIAASAGTAVQAADAGTVVYAGNELVGFGNLVLIRHSGGWVTAYGHMQSIAVQRGAMVTRGQTVGAVGQTGSVSSPQLHFEVRQGSKPVDPMPYLGGKG